MPADCLFCRIVAGELPCDEVHREPGILAFKDIHPVAETHVLVVPERHIEDLRQLQAEDAALWLRLAQVANEVAADLGHEQGYRFYVSVGAAGGQTVPHLHVHVMAGSMRRLPA
ncbi:MAG TPA: HIT domain-containing protein [Candidatus Dormibacteraeota bacterium]|nr:HIT domain-containing protein [Candidatus Dormibacteraeota bacterium]